MHRYTVLTLLGMITFSTASFAQGAVPSPPSNAFNWLNLNRNGNSAASNYYQLVRPQFQTQNALMNVQQEYNNLTQSATNPNNNNDPNAVRETGHAATFMNYGRYYPNLRSSAGATGRTGQTGGTGRR